MTGYQFIGRFMQEVTTLCQLIMVWPQTLTKKGENKNKHKAIPAGERSNTAPCGNQGSPQPGSPRSQGASRKDITTHQWSLRSTQRRRRVATRVVKNKTQVFSSRRRVFAVHRTVDSGRKSKLLAAKLQFHISGQQPIRLCIFL